MSRTLKELRIFIASPSGLEKERESFKELINDYNDTEAKQRGIIFTAIGWEDTIRGVMRPQSIINKELKECDYMIILLHNRWGKPPSYNDSKYSSGTEEEFYIALEAYNNKKLPMRDIVLIFKAVNRQQINDPGEQLKKVLKFRQERQKKNDMFYDTFDTVEQFIKVLRKLLSSWLRENELKEKQIKIDLPISPNQKNEFETIKVEYSQPKEMVKKAEKLMVNGNVLEAEIIFSKLTVELNDPWIFGRFGHALRKIGQYNRGKDILLIGVDMLKNNNNDNQTLAYLFRQLGRIEERKGDFTSAENYFNKALKVYRDNNEDAKNYGKTYRDKALLNIKLSKYQEALKNLFKAEEISKTNNLMNLLASIWGYIGLVNKFKGELTIASEYYTKSIELYLKEENNDDGIANVHSNQGVLQRIRKNFSESLKNHNIAMNIFKKMDSKQSLSREYTNIGVVYKEQGKLKKAKELFGKALEISEQLSNLKGRAVQYGNLGDIAFLENDFVLAENYYRRSLEICIAIKDQSGIAIQYLNIGKIYQMNTEYERALELYKLSKKINLKIESKIGIASVDLQIGLLNSDLNNINLAIEYLQKAKYNFEKATINKEVERIDKLLNKLRKKMLIKRKD